MERFELIQGVRLELEAKGSFREYPSLENLWKLRHSSIRVEVLDVSDESHGIEIKNGVANLIQHRRKKIAAVPINLSLKNYDSVP